MRNDNLHKHYLCCAIILLGMASHIRFHSSILGLLSKTYIFLHQYMSHMVAHNRNKLRLFDINLVHNFRHKYLHLRTLGIYNLYICIHYHWMYLLHKGHNYLHIFHKFVLMFWHNSRLGMVSYIIRNVRKDPLHKYHNKSEFHRSK